MDLNCLGALRIAWATLPAVAAALLAGCATREIRVDAMRRTSAATANGASYRVCQHGSTTAADDLRFQEAAGYIKTALSSRGMWESPNPHAAQFVVELDYEVTGPRQLEHSLEIPVVSTAESRAAGAVIIRPASSEPHRDDSRVSGDGEGGREAGSAEILQITTVREKRLSVACRENKPAEPGHPPAEVWRVGASLEDPGRDLREALPALATAVMNHLGTDSGGATTESVDSHDEAVQFIKRGL